MITATFYNTTTGEFRNGIFAGNENDVGPNTPAGHAAMVGVFDHRNKRVDLVTGLVVDKLQESELEVDLSWSTRMKRDQALNSSDWTQSGDAPLDDVQRAAWRTYRQSLRDLTKQATFPESVAWPKQPE